MKYLLSLLLVALFLSCKQEPKIPVEPEPQLTILDSIGMVYGYPNWSKVNSIHFTFNVVGDPGYKRSWKWDVRKQEVTSVIEEDTVTYLRRAVDSTVAEVDARFINDKYWLLVPFNLVWDQENFTYSIEDEVMEGALVFGNWDFHLFWAPRTEESLRKYLAGYLGCCTEKTAACHA